MSKKPTTATALAGILSAKRGGEEVSESPVAESDPTGREQTAPPSPALPDTPSPVAAKPPSPKKNGRIAKSKDPSCDQFSVYLRKDTRKKAGRLLEDTNPDMDFSDLMQELLEQWIASRT